MDDELVTLRFGAVLHALDLIPTQDVLDRPAKPRQSNGAIRELGVAVRTGLGDHLIHHTHVRMHGCLGEGTAHCSTRANPIGECSARSSSGETGSPSESDEPSWWAAQGSNPRPLASS
jgi:hypothetical protein